jgi:hypothetical protein
MDASRKIDTKIIERGMESTDPLEREVAKNAGKEVSAQLSDSWTRDARERLIKETQAGNSDNARQVREDMIKHRGGRQGKGNRGEEVRSYVHWRPGEYERIFGYG